MGEQRKDRGHDRGHDRGGPSIVGVSGAMRARDVSRPRPEHEAAAAQRLVIRRRPPDADARLPRTR